VSTVAVFRHARRIEPVAGPVAPGWLRPPPLRSGVVERPRLLRLLDQLTRKPLTVVAAPTGYGKTTLLASWAVSTHRRVAWASLGSRELDADRFWGLVAAALEQADPRLRFGSHSQRVVGTLSQELILVLDGYEQATHAGVDADFRQFLELAPETLHVVVCTRGDPGLALALRRAQGTVAEIGARELRLDGEETAAVLRHVLGNRASEVDADAVARRTEGWPAAVYLAALAAPDANEARDVADYLRLELLDAQGEATLRSFLLETSVLERLSAPLCDELLRRRDSGAMLRTLLRRGAFLVPLEGPGREYRYLRPVREFLQAELARVAPARADELQMRAAIACEHAGLFEEAADHARRAAGDDAAGSLLDRHALELVRDGHTEHLKRLLATRAGAAAARRHPALGAELHRLVHAGSDVPALNAAAERIATLGARLPSGQVRSLLQSTAQAARAYALLLSGDVAGAYEAAVTAAAQADPDSGAPAGQAAAVASLAASRLGLGTAAAPFSRAGASALKRRGVRSGTAAALVDLARAAVAEERGDPAEAERLCLAGLRRTVEPATRTFALLHLARLHGPTADSAREALEQARLELSRCDGAELLEQLAAETESKLAPQDDAHAANGELSPAEQRVLQLLMTKLTQREIASELYVSLNTVKTHARVIYRKLGVGSRTAAVAAARDLNLLGGNGSV
jgi:LuxR family maltose regulon positive regulatory protein